MLLYLKCSQSSYWCYWWKGIKQLRRNSSLQQYDIYTNFHEIPSNYSKLFEAHTHTGTVMPYAYRQLEEKAGYERGAGRTGGEDRGLWNEKFQGQFWNTCGRSGEVVWFWPTYSCTGQNSHERHTFARNRTKLLSLPSVLPFPFTFFTSFDAK